MRRFARRLTLLVFALTLFVGRVAAHDPPDSRFDAPIPLELLFGGAAVTVGLTALVLARGSVQTRGLNQSADLLRIPAPLVRGTAMVARVGFLALVSLAVVAALVGPQTDENLATVFVWAVWLKGVGLLAAVVGTPWRTLSPWRTLLRVVDSVRGEDAPFASPEWLGHAPALVGVVLVVGIVENLTAVPQTPRATGLLVGAYAVFMLAGGLAFGPVWFRRADFFDVLYRLFGRVAPLELATADGTEDEAYTLRLRSPWAGCTEPVSGVAVVAVVVATVYTVSFDGFTNTIQYEYLLVDVGVATRTGVGVEVVAYLAGFLLFVVGFVGVVAASEGAGGRARLRTALAAFAPTVLPIAVAYEVAHTYPFVLRSAVAVLSALTATTLPDPLGWLSLPVFWGSQVVLITVGHIAAVVAAHHVTRRRYANARAASRAHVPLTVLMVGYTVLSLWIVSLPLVR